ncbi:hypothetical protein D0Z03_002256 [Geotrichum reessii]|nr:hypothetical protein D0Z03_002256 [Galactomyces reessii]
MKSTIATKFSVLAAASFAAAHGIVTDIKFDNDWYTSSLVFQDPYANPVPERITWSFFGAGNGPVPDFTTKDIVCNKNAKPAALVADVKAGAKVTFYWTVWPESHKGPVMTYLANCGGDCRTVDPSSLSYFKIDHAGYENGEWISDKIIANNNSYSLTIPEDIAPGNYLIRHELLALHSAFNELGAQFYPMCANLKISGSGTANPPGVKFPEAYPKNDAGILVNIYNGLTSYKIPGPAPYKSGSGSSGSSGVENSVPSVSKVNTPAASADPATTAAGNTAPAASATTAAGNAAPAPSAQNGPSTGSYEAPAAPATVAPSNNNGNSLNLSQKINKCLDDINVAIAKAQAKNGGSIDFSKIEAGRANCYKMSA